MIEMREGDRKAAFDAPLIAYGPDSRYVPPLWSDFDRMFDPRRNPFVTDGHGRYAMFSAHRDGRPAASLISDRDKTLSAAGIVLFHRPRGEDALLTGRHFYRLWLELDRAGLAACPVSALADHTVINDKLSNLAGLGDGRRLVNVFRAGRPWQPYTVRHFRQQLIV